MSSVMGGGARLVGCAKGEARSGKTEDRVQNYCTYRIQ